MKKLVETLKENEQDFEFYPTTKEIIECIYNHRFKIDDGYYYRNYVNLKDVLDIGCGTCNFKKYIEELNKDKEERKQVNISNYYVMEKSKILIDQLDKDVIMLGTDFHENNLIDKKVDTIFCNPPYSEYELWTKRIIQESNCKEIYLVIPERWKENEDIINLLKKLKFDYEVIGNFNFLNAERQARVDVDIVYIDKKYYSENLAFDLWFDETFKIEKKDEDLSFKNTEKIKNEIIEAENKIEMMVKLYNEEMNVLYNHFKTISNLDVDILKSIGVDKNKIKESLKHKHKNLKCKYWELVFEYLDEITKRLTSKTRRQLLDKFTKLKEVDFNAKNIYSLVIWVVKNSNQYFDEQLINFFKTLSCSENVVPYKSNQRIGTSKWRFFEDNDHYTLDYRIICSRFNFEGRYSFNKSIDEYRSIEVIDDICAVINNLGFEVVKKEIIKEYGKTYKIYTKNDEVLFEYKYYMNRNTHIKFNKEVMKAINVEVSRLLGWINKPEDIQKEFCDEMKNGAEKYFKINNCLKIENLNMNLIDYKI